MVESGYPKIIVEDFYGLFAPPRTPADVVNKLAAATQTAVQSPKMGEAFKTLGFVPEFKAPQEFGMVVKAENERWGPLVKASGFTSEE
jgi:tripartite-type tricarboxylate transporter receptor subunit TctC